MINLLIFGTLFALFGFTNLFGIDNSPVISQAVGYLVWYTAFYYFARDAVKHNGTWISVEMNILGNKAIWFVAAAIGLRVAQYFLAEAGHNTIESVLAVLFGVGFYYFLYVKEYLKGF